MKNTRRVLLAGVLSLSVGCQPDMAGADAGSALTSQRAALESKGSWTRNAAPSIFWPETANVISSGEVLLIAGKSSNLYNPYANTWRDGGSTPLARSYGGDPNGHTVTALSSGKLLIAGGHNPNESDYYRTWSDLAYLYDPATNTYTPTGRMSDTRGRHVAVPLPSGKVLVLGGNTSYGNSYITGASELYDPDKGTWSAGAYDLETRAHPTATVLYSGEVMVAGGHGYDGTDASVTLYNPSTNSWRRVASLPHGRVNHLALRLYSGQVMVLGGDNGSDPSVDLFNPYGEQWSAGSAVPISGPYRTATMLYSGEILVTSASGQAALYSPGSDTWSLAGSLQAPFTAAGTLAVRLDVGQVLLLGGSRPGDPGGEYIPTLSDTQRYLP